MDETAKHYKAVVTGKRNKMAGEHWENMIAAACRYYSEQGIAEIEKTPEPMKPIKPLGGGKYIAVFTKMAQPDYKGTLLEGEAIIFEAKHTDAGRLGRDVISSEQEKKLDRHEELGAQCYVVISFGFERYYRVPWNIFRDMKQHFGRKYVTSDDLAAYEVPYKRGVVMFLE